ncbi:hypothetical protein IMSAGC011_02978 [Lachnospiraceae bacterium]|nr:hypothetical protein IMSAGC011_02978 [Lachnospiraceae bacterium]
MRTVLPCGKVITLPVKRKREYHGKMPVSMSIPIWKMAFTCFREKKRNRLTQAESISSLIYFPCSPNRWAALPQKKRSRALSRQKRKNRSCQRTCCQKNSLTQSCGVGAAGITAASAFMRSTSRARHRRKWQNFSGKNTKLPEKALNLKENSYPYGSMSRE